MHTLQQVFATAQGEAGWTAGLHALFAARAFDEAEALLAEVLTALDSELAWTCLELPREAVVLSGWEELGAAIAAHEGDPVTGVTIAIGNEADRDFAKGQIRRPYVLIGLYTDEAFEFSTAAPGELIAQCGTGAPAWAGLEEDVEVHLDIEGLDGLNTRLAHHKQRHFLRDDAAGGESVVAPPPYIEFVVACWWRALRWHQAVATECLIHGLPRAIPVVAGMVDMRPEAVAVHRAARDPAGQPSPLALVGCDLAAPLAGSFGDGFIQRRPVQVERASPTASALRRRVQASRIAEERATKRPGMAGLWHRILGRHRSA